MPPSFATHDASAAEYSKATNTSVWSFLPRRALTWAGYAVFAVAAAFVSAGTVVPALLGYHSTAVYGGSMGSSLPGGSMAITQTISFEDVGVGDVIAFSRSGTKSTVMHRVVAIEERDGQRVATLRGDSNAAADAEPLILTSGHGDRLVYHVSLLGYVLHYSRTTTVVVPALVAVAFFVAFEWLRGRRRAATQRKN